MTTVSLNVTGSLKVVEAVNKFLVDLEAVTPKFIGDIAIRRGEDNIIQVEATYRNDDEANQALECMSKLSTDLLVETGVWVVLTPVFLEEKGT